MQINTVDEQYMLRCLELARNGEGRVAPNPMVGAVIVHNGRIIGEGYHTQYGAPHAEVMAVQSVQDKSLLKESTIYVSLEPCCHHGKTPPCAQMLADIGIQKVVFAATDPNPKVCGGGVRILQDKGIEVVLGILESEARELNKFFYAYHEKKRPYIILKWAESTDGYIDSDRAANESPAQISNLTSQTLVHRWRSEVQAIMAGTNTVLCDNPQFTVRRWLGNNPLRVVVDREQRILPTASIFNDDAETLLFLPQNAQKTLDYGEKTTIIRINFDENIEEQILNELHSRKIQSLFIEGGAKLINSFILKDLWDEARVFIGNTWLGGGVKAPQKPTVLPAMRSAIGGDTLLVFRQKK